MNSNLRQKINDRMDSLQIYMEANRHLTEPEVGIEIIESVSKFWSVLSDEDKDYLHCAQDAIDEKVSWNIT